MWVSDPSTFVSGVTHHGGCNGYRESGFDSGEGALKTATTSKEGSRREN